MRYFSIEADRSSGCSGAVDGSYRWRLPGIMCPACGATWSAGFRYPSVDLTPVLALGDFEAARPEPVEEYERLRDLVRPLLPPRARLEPGSNFGPFVGKAQGRFGSFVLPLPWWLLVQREALDQLQAEGLRGLKGCHMELRFRQRRSPELLDLEILPVGRVHPECLSPDRKPPCSRCGHDDVSLPDALILDATTLPRDLDLFLLEDVCTVIVCTERFVDACRRLKFYGVGLRALPTKAS
jgi:uncharacterized double-CXXCG motif protein